MNAVVKVASTSAVVALVLATVWLFWPSGLGGATTYVTTQGTSMEPRFHTGDLAVLTPASSYGVGDVVAYRSEALHTIVMHRIVSMDGDRFVTKGDNNGWVDRDHPTRDEILGRLFVRVPRGGQVIAALRSPGLLLPLAGGLLAVLGALHDPRGRRTARWVRHRVPAFAMSTRGRARQVAVAAAVVAAVSAVGCGALLTMPPTQRDLHDLQVTQKGQFSYSGRAAAGTTYPTGSVSTGDTVWNRLVHDLTASLSTRFSGLGPIAVTGSVRLDVVVAGADGWNSVVGSGTPVPLMNGTATAVVGVDTAAAARRLQQHYAETGTSGAGATLTVRPVADVTGTVQGRPFTPTALNGLSFALDEMSLRPSATDAAAFAPITATSVKVQEVSPRRFMLLSASVPMGTARKIMGAVLVLSLVALCVGAWVGRIGRGDVTGRFLARHADRILPVTSFTPGATVIDVSDAESLHRVAERFDTLVLHHAGEDEDVFAVRDIDATYRFVVPGSAVRRPDLPPVPPPPRAQEPASGSERLPADTTTPLERVAPARPSYGGLWRVA